MATITITIPAAEETRVTTAFRDRLGPTATLADVKAWIIEQMKGVVHSYETRLAAESATASIVPIEPT